MDGALDMRENKLIFGDSLFDTGEADYTVWVTRKDKEVDAVGVAETAAE